MTDDNDTPSPPPSSAPPRHTASKGMLRWAKNLLKARPDTSLREAIEEYIVEPEDTGTDSVSRQERLLLSNILKLRDITVDDVMVPRAEIFAINESISQDELLDLLRDNQFSRLPVYRDTLDNVLGTIHIKDILAAISRGQNINIEDMITDIPIVSPAMPVLNLILEMRAHKRHMAMVVDEFGGIDGLVTVGDVIESIVGELDDEHNNGDEPNIRPNKDGSITVDARVELDDFEEKYGLIFSEEERYENDTLGGLVSTLAGRVPARGEVLSHHTGMVFEILDADPRRVYKITVRNIPEPFTRSQAPLDTSSQ